MTKPAKNKGGRPKGSGAKTLNEEQKKLAGQLAGVGCNLEQIAAMLDMAPATLDALIAKDPSVSQAISKGRGGGISKVAATAYQMAISGKQPAMTIFFLKTRARWAEARDVAPEENDDNKNDFTLNYAPKNE